MALVEYLHDPVPMPEDDTGSEAMKGGPLVRGLPTYLRTDKLETELTKSILPPLVQYLNSTDEETVSLRIPLALTVTKLLTCLQSNGLIARLPGVLSNICHVLRSRSQDARDMTRKILGLIARWLGPKYFSYILVELKTALRRGYQLHVLGFSIHTTLLKLEPAHGVLDYCIPQLVDVLVEDLFGETETASPSVLRKVEEVLRRIGLGLNKNVQSDSRDALLLFYNIYVRIQRTPRWNLSHTNANIHKLQRFVIDGLRLVLHRTARLKTAANLSQLLPIIRSCLLTAHQDLQISTLRLLSEITTIELDSMISEIPMYIDRALTFVRGSPSSKSEICQAAMKFIATLLQDRRQFEVPESSLVFLLQHVRTDLEEPDSQSIMFALLKGIMQRKTMLPELYDLMDDVGIMMVRNQSASARASARTAYYQFLTGYPLGKVVYNRK
ncbi:hypothetical protein MRB53_042146 [Persea americana]|nr:hypothetical protein MRB53_042146 [Persea americana]